MALCSLVPTRHCSLVPECGLEFIRCERTGEKCPCLVFMNDIDVPIDRYTDMAAVKVHGASKEFKAFGKKMADEGLQEKPLTLQFIKSEGTGFDRAAKL